METIGTKSKRLLITNSIMLVIALALTVVIAIFASSKVLALIPAVLAIANISMIVEYFTTPNDVLIIDGDDLLIKKAMKKEDRVEIAKIVSILYSKYSAKSDDGILSILIENMDKPMNIPAIRDVANVRDRLFTKRSEYGFDNVLKVANAENSDTSNDVFENNEDTLSDDKVCDSSENVVVYDANISNDNIVVDTANISNDSVNNNIVLDENDSNNDNIVDDTNDSNVNVTTGDKESE